MGSAPVSFNYGKLFLLSPVHNGKIRKTQATNVWFVNMQKPVYTVHTVPFVFAQKTNKFQFAANGM